MRCYFVGKTQRLLPGTPPLSPGRRQPMATSPISPVSCQQVRSRSPRAVGALCTWAALTMSPLTYTRENRPRRDLGSCGRHGTAPAHLPPPPRGCKAVILKTTNCPLTLSIALFVTVRAITSRQEAAIYHRKHFPKLGASLES